MKQRRKIDFGNIRSADFKAVLMAQMGLSDSFISDKTGLTSGQIHYRTKQCAVYRRDYRNGNNDVCLAFLKNISLVIGPRKMVRKSSLYSTLRDVSLRQDRNNRRVLRAATQPA